MAIALHGELDPLPDLGLHGPAQLVEGPHRLAVDSGNDIPQLHPGLGRREPGLEAQHPRRGLRIAGQDHEEDQQGEQEIEGRPSSDDQHPLPGRLGQVAPRFLLGRDLLPGHFPGHLHVAAQREDGDPILCLAAGEAEQAWSEPDREAQDLHSECLGGEEVAQLVDEDQDAEENGGVTEVLEDHPWGGG